VDIDDSSSIMDVNSDLNISNIQMYVTSEILIQLCSRSNPIPEFPKKKIIINNTKLENSR